MESQLECLQMFEDVRVEQHPPCGHGLCEAKSNLRPAENPRGPDNTSQRLCKRVKRASRFATDGIIFSDRNSALGTDALLRKRVTDAQALLRAVGKFLHSPAVLRLGIASGDLGPRSAFEHALAAHEARFSACRDLYGRSWEDFDPLTLVRAVTSPAPSRPQ